MTDCIAKHHDDREPHPAAVGFLCRGAYGRLEQHLAELPALYAWLQVNLAAAGSGGFGDYTTGSRDRPTPIRIEAHDHLALITETLRSWTQLVAEERDLTGPTEVKVPVLATFLVAHLPWSAEQMWVDDFAEEVEELTRLAHSLAPSEPRLYRMPAPCPTCGASELTRHDGDDYVACQSCGRLWTEDDYRRLCVLLVDEQRRAAPLPEWASPGEVAAKYGVKVKTVRTWARREVVPSKVVDGRLLVRSENVQEHIEQEKAS